MRSTLISLLLAISLYTPVFAAAIEVQTDPVNFNPEKASISSLGKLSFVKGVEYKSDSKKFGGFSALLFQGDQLFSVTDKGHWLKANIDFSTLALTQVTLSPLHSKKNKPLIKKKSSDAESLASDGTGGFYVTFERKHRITHYKDLSGPAITLPHPQGLKALANNHGVEAAVKLKDGRLVIFAEASDDENFSLAWFLKDKEWKSFSYRRYDDFKPTGAALLPSGDLLILERRFTLLSGIAIRLRKVSLDQIKQGNQVEGDLLGELAPPLTVDNFEGVAVRVNKQGEILIYLLSDDNFSALQQTLLMVFKLEK
ncbi:MAG: esterase-like activity of phytase family protein [Rhodospirillales bacterium]|nr:esterase-like activity of phytase family protein [Rhodospirillales bacterium]